MLIDNRFPLIITRPYDRRFRRHGEILDFIS